MKTIKKPIKRNWLRKRAGVMYYTFKRKQLWLKNRKQFASHLRQEPLEYVVFKHETILLRKLKDVEMWLQHNKIINLKIATKKLNGLILKPHETMSYWKLIGKTTKSKGYVEGMILVDGHFETGIGGGICQLSNLIFWMTLHTPLTVIERHHHGYDVFPDSNRTQPFGSGATCFYPYGDLMIQNNTDQEFQLMVSVGEKTLMGEWRSNKPLNVRYKIEERDHEMKPEWWGGYGRYNELYQMVYDLDDQLIDEKLVVKNAAMMTYSPLVDEKEEIT